jgi:hypothetical protein
MPKFFIINENTFDVLDVSNHKEHAIKLVKEIKSTLPESKIGLFMKVDIQ